MVPTVEWKDGAVRLLNQSRLPEYIEFLDCRDYRTVVDAIRSLKVRGAPAIGVTAAMGVALGAQTVVASDYEAFAKAVLVICDHLAATRPTAVNLFWAIERMKRMLASLRTQPIASIKAALLKESQAILDEDVAFVRQWDSTERTHCEWSNGLTHCNAGALATAGCGTALGVIRAAWEQGKQIQVIADETRPVLQGARLTAWELMQDKIPVTLITDNMAGALMRQGKIHLCIVGLIGSPPTGMWRTNWDVLSRSARESPWDSLHVAAPYSTIDMKTKQGRTFRLNNGIR
jgi:methylthioribose-1-phosphate isomerase